MNPDQLRALVAQHKTAALGAAAAGVAGLALYRKKKGTAGGAPTAGATIPGTIPAAAVVPATPGSPYDSSAYDVYNALQPQIAQLISQQSQATGGTTGGGVTAPPPPVASTLFAPSQSGQYVQYQDGSLWQVQNDGSMFGVTQDQYNRALAGGATSAVKLNQHSYYDTGGPYWSTQGNVAAKGAGADLTKGTQAYTWT